MSFAASINIAIGIILLITQRFFSYRNIAVVGVLVIFLFLMIPNYDIRTMSIGPYTYHDIDPTRINEVYADDEILFYKETLYSTVLVLDNEVVKKLTINGKKNFLMAI